MQKRILRIGNFSLNHFFNYILFLFKNKITLNLVDIYIFIFKTKKRNGISKKIKNIFLRILDMKIFQIEIWLKNKIDKIPNGFSILDAGAGELQYKNIVPI